MSPELGLSDLVAICSNHSDLDPTAVVDHTVLEEGAVSGLAWTGLVVDILAQVKSLKPLDGTPLDLDRTVPEASLNPDATQCDRLEKYRVLVAACP